MTYNKSDQFYAKPGTRMMCCACMGPQCGEPLCPCSMAKAGLPMSKENVEATEKAKVEMAIFFKQWQERP